MRRNPITKLEALDARYPGLGRKVDAMLAEFWRPQEVKQMIQTQYGERLSLRSVERYKSKHWRVVRQRVQEMSEALNDRVIGRSGDRVNSEEPSPAMPVEELKMVASA